jgi:hypothetical protein
MFKKTLFLAALLSILLACNSQAEVMHSTWVGGEMGSWIDSTNWDPSWIPLNGFGWDHYVVTINKPPFSVDEVTVYMSGIIIDRLDCYGKVTLESAFDGSVLLSFAESKPPYPPYDVNCLANHGDLSIIRINIKGRLYNLPDATISIEGKDHVEGILRNEGLIMVGPAAELNVEGSTSMFRNAGQLLLANGFCPVEGLFQNDSNGIVTGTNAILHSGTSIENNGEVWAQAGSLTISSAGPLVNRGLLANRPLAPLYIEPSADVNNQGRIEINTGGGVAFDCNLVNYPNAIIRLLGGTLAATTITQSADANLIGFGEITADVIVDPNGLIKLTGPTNVVGDMEIRMGATLEISDGTTLITGQTTCNGTIHLKGGRIIPQGGLSGDCNILWEPGLYTTIADFNLDGKVNLKDFAYFADTWLWEAPL